MKSVAADEKGTSETTEVTLPSNRALADKTQADAAEQARSSRAAPRTRFMA